LLYSRLRQGDPSASDAGIANSIISLVMTTFGKKLFLFLSYFFNKRKKTESVCLFKHQLLKLPNDKKDQTELLNLVAVFYIFCSFMN